MRTRGGECAEVAPLELPMHCDSDSHPAAGRVADSPEIYNMKSLESDKYLTVVCCKRGRIDDAQHVKTPSLKAALVGLSEIPEVARPALFANAGVWVGCLDNTVLL